MDNRKGFSTVFFVMAILLICCNPTSSFVNQTTVQQPTSHKGWSYFFEHPIPAKVPPNKQFGVQTEENLSGQQVIKQNAIGPAPVTLSPDVDPIIPEPTPIKPPLDASGCHPVFPKCGRGPLSMPARSLSTDMKVGGAGVTVASRPWPFLVNLRKSTDPPGVYFCSGSLISCRHVLLAAQCLEKLADSEFSSVTLLLGQTNEYGLSTAITKKMAIYVIPDRHSSYNPLNYANDIAIITMDSPVTFSSTVYPVCLPAQSADPDQHAGNDAAVMGWGPTTPGTALPLGFPSTDLKQGKVTIMSLNTFCMSSYFSPFVTSSNICVMTPANNKYTCMADIGGPVVINTAPAGWIPVWTQVGINSFTRDCMSTGLKTRVSAFRQWINESSGV